MSQQSPEVFAQVLSRISWDVFGTLTFRGRVPRPLKARGMAWRHMRYAAEISGQPYSRLLIALREEHGEKNGRFHFHYLLAGTRTRNAITFCHQLEHQWKGSTGGIVMVRPFDRSRSGVDYLLKCLSGHLNNGANAYEMRKFDQADQVTLSRSVIAVIQSLDRMGTNAAERTRRQNGDVLSVSPSIAG